MLKAFLELIPKRLFYFLVGGLVVSYLGSYVLNYLTNFNYRKIDEIKSKIESTKLEYSDQIRAETYQALMHFIMLKYLIDNKKSIIPLINEPPKYLPKFLKINSVNIENKGNRISINGQVDGWINYARFKKYFQNNGNLFKEFKIDNFSYDNSLGVINVSFSFIFNKQ
ncbi:MAG: hypothetical protein KatS3mg094_461 [Candidatus Parcubacteria bacterium]|nr:MAG: hypothetical protein KatS3mg094_461 [Candidatus Parcubacteria bacterium]